MAKQDTIRECYDRAVDALFSDRNAIAEYLKFSGRFYKLPSSQTITLFDDNPNAQMVADYETWQRFGRTVKPNGWATEVVANDGQIKRLFDISMTRGEKVPYQWRLDKYSAEKYMEQLSERVPQPFTNMSGAVNYLSENGVNKAIGEVFNKLIIPENKADDFKRSFYTMVRAVVAARCEWNSDFSYNGGAIDLSAADMLRDADEFETLLEEVQITAKEILKSMENSINKIIYERSIQNGRIERTDGARDNGAERASAKDLVRSGEAVSSVDESTGNAQRNAETVSAERENVRVRADDRTGTDGDGTGTDVAADQPLGAGVAAVYDGELPGGYSEVAGQITLGADTAQDRQGSLGDRGENAGGISTDKPAPDLGERDVLGGTSESTDRGADNGVSGERAQDGTLIENNETAEEHSPAVSSLAAEIAEFSDKFTEKYDGDYRQFTLANFAFNTSFKHRSAEYSLNKPVRENVEKMLSGGDIPFIRDYLNAVYKEAFEGRVIVEEGEAAKELLGRLSELEHTETEHEVGEQLRLIPEPLNKKQQAELEKLTADLTREFDRWERVRLDGGSDRLYEDGVSLELIRNHIISYKRDLEEKFPENLPEIYNKETPPEYPRDYQSVKKGDVLRFEYGDFLVESIAKKDEFSGEYSVVLRDENGETITQDLSAIKTKFRNLTNRGEETRFWEPPADLNKFYVDRDRDEICMVYYNPDSSAGGSLVYNYISFEDFEKALSSESPFNSFIDACRVEWLDRGASVFEESMRDFMRGGEDFQSRGNTLPGGLAELLAERKEEARQNGELPENPHTENTAEVVPTEKEISDDELSARLVQITDEITAKQAQATELFAKQEFSEAAKLTQEISELAQRAVEMRIKGLEKNFDDLKVGDTVRGDGADWTITKITGDFSINYKNVDPTAQTTEQSIYGGWKELFAKRGFVRVSSEELEQNIAQDSLIFSFGDDEYFTESSLLANFANENPNMSFALANSVLEYLDEKQHLERIVNGLNAGWYDKTDFEIKAVIGGEEFSYDGRYDIGDGKGTGGGSLIEHIANFSRHVIKSETGLYKSDNKQTAQSTLDTLIPFLERNSALTAEERKILDDFKAKNPIRTFADVQNVEPKPLTAERSGDFYEFYGEDAHLVAAALGLHITSKNHRDMTGFPVHMFGENAEMLARFGYTLLDGAAIAEERLKESTEKVKAAHEREARFEAAFEAFFEDSELDEKQTLFFERAKKSMQINDLERLEDVFEMPAFQAAYGRAENIYRLFGGEEKFREIEKKIDAALSGEQEQLTYFDEPVSSVEPTIEKVSPVTQSDVISDFRKETEKRFNKIDGYSVREIEELAKDYISEIVSDNNLDVEVGEVVMYGSRSRGLKNDGSDIDIVVEMRNSDLKEDALFNILHETPFDIGGVPVDINPIRPEESGSLDDYLVRAEQYLQEKGAKEITAPELQDYRVEEVEQSSFGQKTRYAANVAAIKTLQKIERENRAATPDEQKSLAQYVGWGGIPKAFDESDPAWANEYAELKKLLTPEEYEAARSTVLTAHYTSPTIISAVYFALENFGFKGGNVLEPSMGIGNFFGVMPEEMRLQSRLHGVELDDISGMIAKQLYPNADIQICGYENTAFSDNFFDAAVGNVPFGNYGVADTRYDREHFLIHDYFFAKTLDKVAPGGVVAFITSKGTLDKTNPKVREYLAKRADLIGAIRLPNDAFRANAGTEVTADIIFLQKREKMSVEKPDWCYTAEIADGISVNQYFVDHPEMILGKMELVSGRFGEETACVPIEGADLKEQLAVAVSRLKRDVITTRRERKRDEEHGIIPATANVRNFTFAEVNDKIYFRENNIMREMPLKGAARDRVRGLICIRETFRDLVDAQSEGCSDKTLSGLQFRLNAEYDVFVMNFGHISDIENRKVFAVDDDYNTLCGALELINPETKEVTKADIFSKRTIKPYAEVAHVETPQEALYVSLDMRGHVDIEYMAELCGLTKDEVINDLLSDGLIYKNPETKKYEEAAEYLSGYVREKLRKAQDAAADNPEYERNVTALEKALPPKLGAGDISVRLGAPWIEIADYCKFFREYAQGILSESSWIGSDSVLFRSASGEYKINNKNADKSVASQSSYGTKRMNSYAIFENLLNNRDIAVYDTFELPDGKKKRVMNKGETQLAQEKARQMREAFPKWLWSDPERREKYVEIYNELFNSLVGREYDGSHQTFPGMNPLIELTDHQKNAVMRAKIGGNTLLAHCVGAGKSFEMAASVMEKRRLGLINKACIVVPKHLVGQMSAEWLRLYPEARLLTAKENDFNEVNRQKFIGRCCTGEYDAVIMSYQQFQKIPMSVEYQMDFLTRQMNELTAHLADYNGQYLGADERRSVKDIERMKKTIETKLKKLLDTPHDNSLSFEQLGFDCIVADEAHNYKNGLVVTKMKNVSGIGSKAAKKCEDFLMKTQYLNEKFGERNIILATGTPVSNSMTELYVMQQYLRPSALQRQGLENFDDWASTFGEVVSQLELKPAGDGFRMKKRFARFNNLPELMQTYKDFADIRTAEMLNLPVPEVEGGKPQVISAKPNEFQQAYMQVLAERSEAIHNGSVDPSVDNMLKITNEARLLGLDARCLNPDADNYPNGKVNLLISKVMEIYTETTAQKGVQAIFCDIAINSGKKSADEITLDGDEILDDDGEKVLSAEQQAELLGASKFSVYDYIKQELIRRGVPESEICFAGDAKNIGQRNELYAQLRAGTKRIVLASTAKMGTGANVQTRLCALHNLDIPWKPSDFEQRIGRIVRQGNNFPTVKLFNYVTEGTFDAYMLNLIVTKQKFISQLMSGKTPARTCEDVDEMVLNYSEMQAIASGDPRIKEKIQLDTDVSRLRLLESEHLNNKYQLEDKVTFCQAQLSIAKKQIALAGDDKDFAAKNILHEGEFKMIVNGKAFTERKDAGAELRKAQISFFSTKKAVAIGEYRGFKMSLNWAAVSLEQRAVAVSLTQKGGKGLTYTTELELQNDLGNIMRIENIPKAGIDKRISQLQSEIGRNEKDLAEAIRTKDAPFEYAAELEEKSKRLAQLDAELGVGKKDEVIYDENENPDDDHNRGKDAPGQNKKPKRPKH